MKKLSDHRYDMIDATIIADSISPQGKRITTFVLTFPRYILAELNTHRAFSRNSASSRAIPFNKMVEMVRKSPFIPMAWMKDHSGMQGNEYLNPEEAKNAEYAWLRGRDYAAGQAIILNRMGVTKQLANRMLEAYLWHTAIVTATDFENFFALRHEPAAEIHIDKLAEVMLEEYNNSNPVLVQEGQWHIPFGDNIPKSHFETLEVKLKVATARCARVSYLNFEGKNDVDADIKLHDRLARMGHWSPFEHCAMVPNNFDPVHPYSGNFNGWIQYRKMFSGENKKDNRVLKKGGIY